MTVEIPEDVPEDFLPDDIVIGSLASDVHTGGVVYGLGPIRDTPAVIVIEPDRGRYRVKTPGEAGAFTTLSTWECSCSVAEHLGRCFHLRAAATYDRHARGEGGV
jgi:hypothetical protein